MTGMFDLVCGVCFMGRYVAVGLYIEETAAMGGRAQCILPHIVATTFKYTLADCGEEKMILYTALLLVMKGV